MLLLCVEQSIHKCPNKFYIYSVLCTHYLPLLFLCGNIERNPGPIENNAYTLDILHLNIRSTRNKVENLFYLVPDFDIFMLLLNLT